MFLWCHGMYEAGSNIFTDGIEDMIDIPCWYQQAAVSATVFLSKKADVNLLSVSLGARILSKPMAHIASQPK